MAKQGTCWDGYVQEGMKKKGDRMVPNCVRKSAKKKSRKYKNSKR